MFGFRACAVPLLFLVNLGGFSAAAQDATGGEEQQQLLAKMRKYAQQYVSNLPNFLCVQVTEQFQSGRKATHWRQGDTLTSRLVFNQGREDRRLELVNGRPAHGGRQHWTRPLTTEGEFGILMDRIFSIASATQFAWNSWDAIDGRRVGVFDYSVDAEHSTLRLSLSDLKQAILPYHGSLYGDPETGAIWRISSTSSHIPKKLETRNISTTIDYQEVAIGETNYLLPVRATVLVDIGSQHLRNEIRFESYRKFEADSTITYGSGDPQH